VTRRSGQATFSFGVAFGTIGGFILGVALGRYVFSLVSLLAGLILRRNTDDGNRPKFEWLLQ